MGLNLKELVELAMLDAVMDKPLTLDHLMGVGGMWHELSGRSDVRSQMAGALSQMLDAGEFTVREIGGSNHAPLTGGEAAMLFQRASATPDQLATVEVTITDTGKAHYKTLAHRYYNG